MKYTQVDGVLSVAHNSPEGVLHGHTYVVKVRFRFGADARMLKRHVANVLEPLDHALLPDALSLGENLAEHIGSQLPGCLRVKLSRNPEGIHAIWKRKGKRHD